VISHRRVKRGKAYFLELYDHQRDAQQPIVTTKVQMTLSSIASRLKALDPSSSQQTTPMNFAVGALYALRRANELAMSQRMT
jgi:hypothetical protein